MKTNSPYISREALSLFTPIVKGQKKDLQELLDLLGADVDHIPGLPFADMSEVHFSRFFILEGDEETGVPARLVYNSNFDGPWESHLREIISRSTKLRDLYNHCQGFSNTKEGEHSDLFFNYLVKHRVKPRIFYQATIGRSVTQIKDEAVLHEMLNEFLDKGILADRWNGAGALKILKDAREFVKTQTDQLPQGLQPARSLSQWAYYYWGLVGRVLWVLTPVFILSLAISFALIHYAGVQINFIQFLTIIILVIISGVLIVFLAIRVHEMSHIFSEDSFPKKIQLDYANARSVSAQEDHQIQNQFSMSIPIKASYFRFYLLYIVLWVGSTLVKYIHTNGILFGIPTIHFARFHIDKELKSMLFLSNYDGNWEEYLEDFLTVGKVAVIPSWTILKWCPRTRWLFFPKTGFGAVFKRYVRYHQLRTNIWYSAYRDLTSININNNTKIREGLWKVKTEDEALAWLKLFSK